MGATWIFPYLSVIAADSSTANCAVYEILAFHANAYSFDRLQSFCAFSSKIPN